MAKRLLPSACFTAGGKAKFQIYQPQIDSWDGTVLRAYCAVEATPNGEKTPTFGLLHCRRESQVPDLSATNRFLGWHRSSRLLRRRSHTQWRKDSYLRLAS